MDETPDTPKRKVPIFAKRDWHRPVSKRLSAEEVAAIAEAKQKAEAEAQAKIEAEAKALADARAQAEADAMAAKRAAEAAAREAAKPKPVAPPVPTTVTTPKSAKTKPGRAVAPAKPSTNTKPPEMPPAKVSAKSIVTAAAGTPAPVSPPASGSTAAPAEPVLFEDAEDLPAGATESERPQSQPQPKQPKQRPQLPQLRLAWRPPLARIVRRLSSIRPPHSPKLAAALKKVPLPHTPQAMPRLDTWLLSALVITLCSAQVALAWNAKIGLAISMVAVVGLATTALLRETLRKVAISLAIVPVSQLCVSTVITHNAFQTATVFYGLLLSLTLIYRYLFTLDEPVEKTKLRWTGHFLGLPLMLIAGQLLGLFDYALLRHQYSFMHIPLPLVFSACLVFAVTEEMLLRGLIQQQTSRIAHPVVSVALPSLLYIALCLDRNHLLSIVPAAATGITLSLIYQRKHNLILTTAVNAASKLAYVGLVATFILR